MNITGFFKKYNQALRLRHDWQTALTCTGCGASAVPIYDGWTPKHEIAFGSTPVIYARLHCPQCGKDLRREAGEKLVALFSPVPPPVRNRRILMGFIGLMVGLPLVLCIALFAGVKMGYWGYRAFQGLTFLPILIAPAILLFNWQVNAIRRTCDCDAPDYRFMGMLGRSYCHRCATCGKLLRIRD